MVRCEDMGNMESRLRLSDGVLGAPRKSAKRLSQQFQQEIPAAASFASQSDRRK
jgi:hypothetical protein